MKIYTPVIAESHTPPYKIHRYFARRPWNVFNQLVEVFSDEGDKVVDPFCGGGVTIYEGLKHHRKLIGFDLNPLSILLVRSMVKKLDDFSELDSSFSKIEEYIQFLYQDFNSLSTKKDGNLMPVSWNELAFVVNCNYCGKEVVLSNDNKKGNGKYHCINSKCEGSFEKKGYIKPKDCIRKGYEYLFSVVYLNGENIKVDYNAKRREQLDNHIAFLEKEISKEKLEIPRDKIPLNWDRQLEDLLDKKGIRNFQDFFTKRNLLINLLVLNFIKKIEAQPDIKELLRVTFSSSLRDTNIMAFTNEGWQSGKPTTWSKHAYWIPSQFCEVDVLSSFQKAFNRVRSAIVHNSDFDYKVKTAKKFEDLNSNCNLLLVNQSISDSEIKPNSVDAIITDPPYGSNVQYLELSHFWYVWNKDLYNDIIPEFKKEAISNRKKNFEGAKNMQDYEDNLHNVFAKCFEILKPEKYMVMTFNNKDIGAWLALLISIFKAGFTLEKDGLYFQDGVKNYKQTGHTKAEGSPYGDFIYVFKKPKNQQKFKTYDSEQDFIGDLDKIIKEYMKAFENDSTDRNELILQMFKTTLPKIETFAKANLKNGTQHTLYKVFNKAYLNRIYA